MIVFRHLIAIATLPLTVTVLIPLWLTRSPDPPRTKHAMLALVGCLIAAVGIILFASSLKRFATDGEGTLAPWDPPRRFVVSGPYRFVRNPMISGVVFILFGEAAIVQTRSQLVWALTFLGLNMIQIPLIEEPPLRRRFGAAYEEYCRHVRRFIPRLKPWTVPER
jgi:protein-S-isoprenylcysteine O-methyltransferase Ste14